MFWHLTALSASSPVESILDKENFTLEELLDEEDIIQECKALNSRLINFLRDRVQVEQLLRYITEEPQEDADSKRIFKFPFIACEIFTCEIDVIFKTLVEEEELMNLLFSFLEPTRSHSALLAGYFSKVVICLMLRKTVPLMNYVQVHQYIFQQLVDLIGVTSIMEILVRLVGADDHMYPDSVDVMQWLTDSNLLEMIVDKLNPSSSPEVHANVAETLCAITRNVSSSLASKLSTPSFVSRIFGHLLDDSHSKSGLVSSLSVCISLLDPKRSVPTPPFYSFRGQHMYESPVQVNQETVGAMLPKLGDLLMLLNVSLDDKILPTTYGQLKPPLGKHRLKIVEFIAVLLKTGNEIAEKELISSGTIQRVLDLFFEYPYNNALHHHIESIIYSCLESTNDTIIDHLFQGCGLLTKILQTDNNPFLSGELNQPTLPASGRTGLRLGNLGHITRISNKIMHLANADSRIQTHIQESSEWNGWQATILQERNIVENVYRWACGRPTSLHDRNRDSDEDDLHHDRDYDVAALANNLSQAFRYNVYDNNEEDEEGHTNLGRSDEENYFDDESAEVVISSLRLGDDQGSLFTNSNWFAFQDDKMGDAPMTTASPFEMMDEINLQESSTVGTTSIDDDLVVGVDEGFLDSKTLSPNTNRSPNPFSEDYVASSGGDTKMGDGEITNASDTDFFRFESTDNEDLFADRPMPEWVEWGEPISGSGVNPFEDDSNTPNIDIPSELEAPAGVGLPVSPGSPSLPNGTSSEGLVGSSDSNQKDGAVSSLFEEDVEFVGVESDGTEKAMDKALKEGIVGEAGALKRKVTPSGGEKENNEEAKEFNDNNYWRVDQEIAVSE
uniref:serine/threonine-protein phosphatase 6 regulatory subunit 3-like isoform X2 n=1 Tax=Erigeron canadensis TaxID=72917 RepID=UPI001CB93360|nr:serine/threonine-protein phosphatase 6 regulatory subunit 3-like isoform X2 [Erigeron canadensis]